MNEAETIQTVDIDTVAHREKWLQRLMDEIAKLEAAMPTPNFLPDTGCPPWVNNLEREVRQAMFPVAKLKKGLTLTPQRVGGILGHQCAIAVWMMEYLAVELEKPPIKIDDLKTAEQAALGMEAIRKLHDDWYCGLGRLAKRALASCVDQTYPDMRDFLSAYSAAFARKPTSFNSSSFGNTAFEVYVFMLMYWQAVEHLASVADLHDLLISVFGFKKTGSLKRVEKICQRIGLHYRKPGRPKGQ